MLLRLLSVLTVFCCSLSLHAAEEPPPPKPLQILFLGDHGHHQPEARWKQLQGPLAARGIVLTYTENLDDLNAKKLAGYDGLIVYANATKITPEQEKALLDYVAAGHGFIPLHCASFCFQNSDKYIALVGAQFQKHGGEVVRTEFVEPKHELLKDFDAFTSWDETYVHTKHNEKDRTVIEYRIGGMQAAGQTREPWTWTRTHGEGRVFYTAWGHDERTFGNAGFQNLVERGIRWACKSDLSVVKPHHETPAFPVPKMTAKRTDVQPFEYDDVGLKIPNYIGSSKSGKKGETLNLMQRPLEPDESLKHYQVPAGFELRLFASEKDFLNKPIAMNWDERGRLWLCETLDYPNELQPKGQGRDRIRICEDTDNDGTADKFTIFAEGLSIPTAILPIRGGCLVHNATETLFLKDTDGDGKADLRKVLVTGWAAGDTHGGVSNFQLGPDNWVWAMQGYNASKPVLTNGEQQPAFRMGFFRMKLNYADPPEIEKIEFLRSTDNNTWGLGFTEEGYVFGSTANRNPSVFLPIPNRYYEAVRGWTPELLAPRAASTHLFAKPGTDKIRQVDQFDGYTAGAGHAVYTAREYPKEYWNRVAFICEPTAHIVGAFIIEPDGAGFKTHTPFNILQSDDEWAAPIMAEVGPDGNLWILDWYNFIVQHNPTPAGFKTGKGNAYESDLRDKRHGRIYRLIYTGDEKGGKPVGTTASTTMDLSKAKPEQLIAALKSDNRFWRMQAQRLLVEKFTEITKQKDYAVMHALVKLAKDTTVNEYAVVHAINTLSGMFPQLMKLTIRTGGLESVANELAHVHGKNPSVAIRYTIFQNRSYIDGMLLELQNVDASEPTVKLAKLLALTRIDLEQKEAVESMHQIALDSAIFEDRWLREAFTCFAANYPEAFFALANSDQAKFNPSSLSRLLPITTLVAEHVARGKPDAAATRALLARLAAVQPEYRTAMLNGLDKGWPKNAPLDLTANDEKLLAGLLKKTSTEEQGTMVRWANTLGSKEMKSHLNALASGWSKTLVDTKAATAQRLSSAKDLVSLLPADAPTVTAITAQLTPQASPELVTGLLDALAQSTAANLAPELLAAANKLSPASKNAALRVLLKRPATTEALLDAIEAGKLSASDLLLDQRSALAAHPDKKLAARAKKLLAASGGLPNADREVVIKQYHAASDTKGDAAAGKLLFKANCAKCHKHSGEGETIGPDLTGMNVHPKHELLTQILDPSRSVEANFRVYQVETSDGLVRTGLLAAESQTTIELVDTEAKKIAIRRDEIESLTAGTKSLMPEGFEKQLTVAQMTDVLEFLAQRGKYVPLPLAKAATIVSTHGMFYDENNRGEALDLGDWKPRVIEGIPFMFVDPAGGKTNNVVLLNGPQGKFPPTMPKSVTIPCAGPAKAIHLLGGVSGWGHPGGKVGDVSLVVRLHYADGQTEEHELKNGVHLADYIRRVDVPESKFALDIRGRQLRLVSVKPKRAEPIKEIELVKGRDQTAPLVIAVTAESP
jgi:putative membrane-bound dehydrogenase-like protein